ncbi:MAG TPA: DUF1302 family protein [Porticoccaceae bacterium]|nr:DUF1302 family protein [Porticoccaceae bacterium]
MGVLALAAPASAFRFDFKDPEVQAYLDSTVTVATAMRTQSAKHPTFSASGNWNIFNDAGDIYSTPLTYLGEFGISKGDYGLFTRFKYIYDYTLNSKDCSNCEGRTPGGTLDGVPDGTQDAFNKFSLLDAFVFANWDVGGHALSARVGKQVISWGESNIMGGGISTAQSPEDVNGRVTPGAEVKERLLPQEMVWTSFDITDTWNIEAYYVWNWRPSTFIAVGTLFSPFDFLGPGFNPDLSLPGVAYTGADYADRGGQWGLATRFIIEGWNSAELGLYWVRSHGFIPYLQADFDSNGVGPLAPLSNLQLGAMSYQRVFAEDQDTYAISLGGELGKTGLSYGTEFNLRENFIDTRQCMNGFGLAGVSAGLGVLGRGGSLAAAQGTARALSPQVAGCDVGASNTWMWLGNIVMSEGGGPFGADRQSYVFDVALSWIDDLDHGDPTDRINLTPLALGGASGAAAADPARAGNTTAQAGTLVDPGRFKGVDALDRPITPFAWGYTAVASFEYNNLFWNLNVKPRFVFAHHVEGYTPFTSGALVENQRTAAVGVAFEYLSSTSLDLAYTWWLGSAGVWDDRDNIALTFKYSF